MYDNPDAAKLDADEPDYSSMTAAEKKKAKAIARKKKKSAEKESQQVIKEGADGQTKKPGTTDEDPKGELLLKRDPLEEAKKYVNTLVNNAPESISTWILRYDVAIRRKRLLMALQVSNVHESSYGRCGCWSLRTLTCCSP